MTARTVPVQLPKRLPATLSSSASARFSGVSAGSGVQPVSRLASELCSSLDRDGLRMSVAAADGQHGASSVSGLKTSPRAGPPSGELSRKKGTTRERLARRRAALVPAAAFSPPKPPARVSAVVCFLRNFSRGFIPAGILMKWARTV